MEMDELHDPDPVDLVASALVDGEQPPLARPTPDDPAVQRAVAELRAVRERVGRVEAGDPVALRGALDVALAGSTVAGEDDRAPEVVDLGERRRRRGLEPRRVLAGAAAVVVLVAAGAGVVASLADRSADMSDAGSATAAVDESVTTDADSADGQTAGDDAAAADAGSPEAAREDAEPPTLDASSGPGAPTADAYSAVDGIDFGTVESIEELRSLVAAEPAAGEHADSAFEEAARSALRFDCPPGLLEEVEVLGRAVVAGWPVIVVRSPEGTVEALKMATCEVMD